jgi:hypothetical protein
MKCENEASTMRPEGLIIVLLLRYRVLRGSIRNVKSHAPNPSATAADEGQY